MFNLILKKYKINDIVIFLSTFISGIIGYTYMFVNLPDNSDTFVNTIGYSHDNYYLWDIECGRWFRAIINVVADFFGYYNVNPYFSFMITLIFISLSMIILFYIFDIKSLLYKILFSIIFVLSPPIIENLSFYFYIIPTFIGLLLTILSMYLLLIKHKYIVSVILLTLSVAIYQPFLFVATTIIILYFFMQILDTKKFDIIVFIKRKYKIILSVFISLIIYLIINHIVIKIFNIESGGRFKELVDFKNISYSFMKMYGAVLLMPFKSYGGFNTTILSKILFSFMYLYMLVKMIYIFRNNKSNKNLSLIILLIILPISMNASMITGMHTTIRTLIAEIFLFLLFIILYQYNAKTKINKKYKNIVNILPIVLLSTFIMHYFYYVNLYAYQSKLASYATRAWCIELVSNIKNKNYYSPDKKIAFVGDIHKMDLSDYNTYIDIKTVPSATIDFVIMQDWTFYDGIKKYAGFNFTNASDEEIENIKNTDRFKKMPVYPSGSSIDVFNDIIVIKISE